MIWSLRDQALATGARPTDANESGPPCGSAAARCERIMPSRCRRETLPDRPEVDAMLQKSVQADRSEQTRKLPGDDLLPNAIGSATHAVTILRPRRDVWPWLVQMGAGRAGWYSYDFIDNGRMPSAEKLLPEFQEVRVGTLM